MEDITTNGRTLLKLILKRKLSTCELDLKVRMTTESGLL
jgi:hypothetical protein